VPFAKPDKDGKVEILYSLALEALAHLHYKLLYLYITKFKAFGLYNIGICMSKVTYLMFV